MEFDLLLDPVEERKKHTSMELDSLLAQMTSVASEESRKFFQFNSSMHKIKEETDSLDSTKKLISDGNDFIRSFSSSSGWVVSSLVQTSGKVVSSEQQQQFTSSVNPRTVFPKFGSFGGFSKMQQTFPQNLCTEIEENTNFAEKKIQMTRSVFEYSSSSSSFWSQSEQSYQSHQTFDVSESESEDEESSSLVRAISAIPPSESEAESQDDSNSLHNQNVLHAIEGPVENDPYRQRSYKIANELLTTERSYVTILHLIDQVFHFRLDQENRAHNMFPQEMVPQMFSNIKSLYKFHSEFLLPQLEERMKNWSNQQKIGDIMKNFAPFLKLYTEYVKNFDNATNIINVLYAKNRKFATLLDELHKLPECGNLTLTHHMLGPIQRLPRYQLLLNDYLKKLPSDSLDRADSQKALELVSMAANHSNEAMKKIDKFKQLLEIEENISGIVDLVSPTRELLKQGKVFKISARTGDHQERYLFLLSDLLLLCSYRTMANRVISGPAYRLRALFNVGTMQVLEGDNLETANTFYIRDNNKNVEFYTQLKEEKASWIDILLMAMQELYNRKSSLKTIGRGDDDCDLGRRAPTLIKADAITKCMECSASFGVIKRKHHCRACGLVICGKCSGQKVALAYEENKSCRVCRHCFDMLKDKGSKSPSSSQDDKENLATNTESCHRGKGVLEVSAEAECVLNGYLSLKTRGKHRSWQKRWFALHPDFVLYSFRSDTDHCAMTATPVPGYTILKGTELKNESLNDKERIFKLFHSKKMYYFQAVTTEEMERWVEALKKAAIAEVYSAEEATNR